jgi:hypothetical protein
MSLWPLWPAPMPPGLYTLGDPAEDAPVQVIPNHYPEFRRYIGQERRLWLVPAGGLDLETAIAVEALSVETLGAALAAARSEIGAAQLHLPLPLQQLAQQAGPGRWTGVDIPLDEAPAAADGTPGWGRRWRQAAVRLRWAAGLGLGQTLLMSAPLALFGTQIWLRGLMILWGVLLPLAAAWPWAPGRAGWLKGLSVGAGAAAVLIVGLALGMSAAAPQAILASALGCLLAGAWLGSLFRGAD